MLIDDSGVFNNYTVEGHSYDRGTQRIEQTFAWLATGLDGLGTLKSNFCSIISTGTTIVSTSFLQTLSDILKRGIKQNFFALFSLC